MKKLFLLAIIFINVTTAHSYANNFSVGLKSGFGISLLMAEEHRHPVTNKTLRYLGNSSLTAGGELYFTHWLGYFSDNKFIKQWGLQLETGYNGHFFGQVDVDYSSIIEIRNMNYTAHNFMAGLLVAGKLAPFGGYGGGYGYFTVGPAFYYQQLSLGEVVYRPTTLLAAVAEAGLRLPIYNSSGEWLLSLRADFKFPIQAAVRARWVANDSIVIAIRVGYGFSF
ncbi:MAG: hypothetical protein FWE37_00695 [Spirochaetaceae bacterium]|nr:hypothetical protein [Spirochaetaceae bacterium]